MKTQNQTQAQILEAIGGLTPKQIEALKAMIEAQYPTSKPIWFSPDVHFEKWHKDMWTIEIESIENSQLVKDDSLINGSDKYYTGRLYLDKATCRDTHKVTFTLFHFKAKNRAFEALAQKEYAEQEAKNGDWENDLMPEIKQFFCKLNQNQIPR